MNRLMDGSISPLLSRILSNRGISDLSTAQMFLDPVFSKMTPPARIKDLIKAATKIAACISNGEKIMCIADYDQDGTASAAIILRSLRSMGGSVDYSVPDRHTAGYGLSKEALLHAKEAGASLVVTVDNGITSVAEADYARSLGLPLIITDHHLPGDSLPKAYAIVNPNQNDCTSGLGHLCGAGVAFYLAIQVRTVLREQGWFSKRTAPVLTDLLDLVAMATVADMVPLVAENRLFVKHGLKVFNSDKAKPGLIALRDAAGIKGEVSAGQIGYFLAPRINAAGRLKTAHIAIDLMSLDDIETVTSIAKTLDNDNRERQEIEKDLFAQAQELIGKPDPSLRSIVVAIPGANSGVIGIVASRIVERYHRPAVVISIDPQTGIGKGSCRGIPGMDMHFTLSECDCHLVKWGGHVAAAGLTINQDELPAFTSAFEESCCHQLNSEDLFPTLMLDEELQTGHIGFGLVKELEALEPHGMKNPRPVFLLRNIEICNSKVLKDTHLKCTLSRNGENWDAIGFGMAATWANYTGKVDVACTVETNEWRGNVSIQIMIKTMRPAETEQEVHVAFF